MSKSVLALVYVLFLLLPAHTALAASNYGAGTFSAGAYGQASCGDNICDSSESCSSCSNDCGSCPSSSSGGGGGGGGGSGFFSFLKEPAASHQWDFLSEGSTASMPVTDSAISITKLEVTVRNAVYEAEIAVEKLADNPAPDTLPVGEVYQYIHITKAQLEDDDISKVVIRFKVSDEWLTAKGVPATSVVLATYEDGTWKELPTVLLTGVILDATAVGQDNALAQDSATDVFHHYEAESDSLSYFAVVARQSLARQPDTQAPSAICVEAWLCTEWSGCLDGVQSRMCADANACGTSAGTPQNKRQCLLEIPASSTRSGSGFALWLWLIGAGMLAASAYLLFIHFSSRASDKLPSSESGDAIPAKYLEKVRAYVQLARRKGVSKHTIRRELILVGWPRSIVKQELRHVK